MIKRFAVAATLASLAFGAIQLLAPREASAGGGCCNFQNQCPPKYFCNTDNPACEPAYRGWCEPA